MYRVISRQAPGLRHRYICGPRPAPEDGLFEARRIADRGELDEHRQIDAGDDFDLAAIHDRNRQIGWRAAEHIGENDNADAAIDLLHRRDDVLAALLHIVFGADGDGGDLLLRADDMFERGAELGGQMAMGDEDHPDHRQQRLRPRCSREQDAQDEWRNAEPCRSFLAL